MKAVVYKGLKQVEVAEIKKPEIEKPTDVIIKMTSSAICGSDLHLYDGHSPAESGLVLGHEPLGVVEEIGDAIELVKPGDRVVIPFNIACGFYLNCIQGLTNECLTTNPNMAGSGYGYPGMGPYGGGQVEYMRVPYGDWACLKLPGEPGDEFEDDFVLLADIFPTAYYSTELADVRTGKTVAIFGAGPVGLLAAYSSILKGASEVYIVDKSKKRLKLAESIGAIPINFTDGDPVEQIILHRQNNKNLMDSLRPGEEKTLGVDCAIDAVGYQANDRNNPKEFKSNQVLMDIARIINSGGNIGIIGVYSADPAGKDENEKQGLLLLPLGELWFKGVTIGTGIAPVKQMHVFLRNLIFNDKAKPSFIVSDHIDISEAPEAYSQFDKRDDVVN
jgi:glutathione-independent formaldehyde dehydrogenase